MLPAQCSTLAFVARFPGLRLACLDFLGVSKIRQGDIVFFFFGKGREGLCYSTVLCERMKAWPARCVENWKTTFKQKRSFQIYKGLETCRRAEFDDLTSQTSLQFLNSVAHETLVTDCAQMLIVRHADKRLVNPEHELTRLDRFRGEKTLAFPRNLRGVDVLGNHIRHYEFWSSLWSSRLSMVEEVDSSNKEAE